MPQPPLIRKGNGAPTAKYLALSASALGAFLFCERCERFFGGHTATSHTTMRRWSNARERKKKKKKPHQKKLHKRGRKGPFLFPLRCFLIQTHNNTRWSLLLCCDVAGEEGKGALYAACVWSLFFLSLFIFRGQKKKRNLSPWTRERYDIHQSLPKLNYEFLPKLTGIALRRLMNLFVSDFVESFLLRPSLFFLLLRPTP